MLFYFDFYTNFVFGVEMYIQEDMDPQILFDYKPVNWDDASAIPGTPSILILEHMLSYLKHMLPLLALLKKKHVLDAKLSRPNVIQEECKLKNELDYWYLEQLPYSCKYSANETNWRSRFTSMACFVFLHARLELLKNAVSFEVKSLSADRPMMKDALDTVAIVSSVCRGYLAFARAGGVEKNLHFIPQIVNLASIFLLVAIGSSHVDAEMLAGSLDLHLQTLSLICGEEYGDLKRLRALRVQPKDAFVDLLEYKAYLDY